MSGAIRAALLKRFAPPEWALFHEVANATGAQRQRAADAIAMNLYPSRGLTIHGVEIKTARSDWLRELKNPDKSAPVQAHCDFWWIATDDPKIAKPEELPPTWGLLVLEGARLVQKVAAPALAAPPIDRGFVAALLRNATANMVPRSELTRLANEMAKPIAKAEDGAYDQMAKHAERLAERIADFERASGVNIKHYQGAVIGEAVRVVLHERTRLAFTLEREEEHLTRVLESIRSARAAIEKAEAG